MEGESSDIKFNLSRLNDLLTRCRNEAGIIEVKIYLEIFDELNRFFSLLGLLGFVVSDVKEKIRILSHYHNSDYEKSEHYQTVQSMIEYEVSNKITVVKGKPPSASRTLLRLHRALGFIIQFLSNLRNASGSQKLGPVATKAYHHTLAKHHIWIVRKTVEFALRRLPTRNELLEKMSELPIDKCTELLDQTVSCAQPVYDTIQELYESNDILYLP